MPSKKSKSSKQSSRNILEHELIPKAEIVPKEEVKKILKQLNAMPWQLPWIRASDPLARSLGAKPGNVIKIYRKSVTAGEIIVYRYVIPG